MSHYTVLYGSLLFLLSSVRGYPAQYALGAHESPDLGQDSDNSRMTYFVLSIALVLLGGVFAGLTLGLMGQDEIYLKVIATSGTEKEQKLAKKVLRLLSKGKHQILVTLLLSNVITNETLPIVLDRFLAKLSGDGESSGGWKAILFSTLLIVIFGEILPQSVCVKYGLQIGSWLSGFVIVLMYILWPISWPIAKLLDHLLGQDHGTMYKKSGLKTLVNLHQTDGIERLTQDEVTIISAVLDLKDKYVSEIMTPIDKVFTLASNTTLDEEIVDKILKSGYSRVPIHLPNEETNFIGMLLVKILISYDPEDCLKVSQFPLATLPETLPNTSSLNILNYFQQGKSHMCIVSENPGESEGALGILTLEDVIEELIGEEIIDESDVLIPEDHIPADRLSENSPLLDVPATKRNPHRNSNHGGFVSPNNNSKIPFNLASNPLNVETTVVKVKRNIPFHSLNNDYKSTSDLSNRSNSNTNMKNSLTSPIQISNPATAIDEANGIVESVITVKGVPKTIIQSTDLASVKNDDAAGLLVVNPSSSSYVSSDN